MHALSDRLRGLGLVEDTSEGAPLCRWRHGNIVVDVMPTDERVLGFSNRWYPMAIDTAQHLSVAGCDIRLVTPALFIATKLEAFHGRGGDDVVAAAHERVRAYISAEIRALLGNPDFLEALSGFLLPDAASQARRGILEQRLDALTR